eukprot:4052738-Pyramimonas_sp.AAC.1
MLLPERATRFSCCLRRVYQRARLIIGIPLRTLCLSLSLSFSLRIAFPPSAALPPHPPGLQSSCSCATLPKEEETAESGAEGGGSEAELPSGSFPAGPH